MRRHPVRQFHSQPPNPAAQAVERANRARRREDSRGEMTALRQACLLDEWNAALWTRFGDALFRAGKHDEALKALRHALWLRERNDDRRRGRVTQRLIECVLNRMPLRAAA